MSKLYKNETKTIEYASKSVQGKRGNLEDYYGNSENDLYIVADGVGSHPYGEVASKIAVESAINTYKSSKNKSSDFIIETMFTDAEHAIQKEGKNNPDHTNMGTTMLAAIVIDGNILFGNLGDCRAYIYSNNSLEQVTNDDRDTNGDLIKALGVHNEDVRPKIVEKDFNSGDLVLLCSDGLHDFVSDKVINNILSSSANLQNKADGLIEAALQFSSTDNITVSLIKL